VAVTVRRSHPDHVADALAGHDAEPLHPHQIGRGVQAEVFNDPSRPRHMPAVRHIQVFDLLERVELREGDRNGPIPDRAADREHLVRHNRRVFHRIAQRLDGDGLETSHREEPPTFAVLEAAHMHFVVCFRAVGVLLELFTVAILNDQVANRAGGVGGHP
jgi:hypothetical protein